MSAELTAAGLVQHLLCFSSPGQRASCRVAVGLGPGEDWPFSVCPQVDLASEGGGAGADSVSLLRQWQRATGRARVQVLARYRWALTPAPGPLAFGVHEGSGTEGVWRGPAGSHLRLLGLGWVQWALPVVNGGRQSVPKAKRWAVGGDRMVVTVPSSSGPPRSYNPLRAPRPRG